LLRQFCGSLLQWLCKMSCQERMRNISKIQANKLPLVAENFGHGEGKHCSGACAAVRLLSWRWELLPEQKTLPTYTMYCTIHLTTLQDTTFQTGSTHAAKTAPPAPRDGMTPLPWPQLPATNSTTNFIHY
jgi:hypothetical protein